MNNDYVEYTTKNRSTTYRQSTGAHIVFLDNLFLIADLAIHHLSAIWGIGCLKVYCASPDMIVLRMVTHALTGPELTRTTFVQPIEMTTIKAFSRDR